MRLLSGLMLIGALAACGGDDTDTLCDREVPLEWDGFGKSFIGTHCVGCHSALIRPEQRRNAPLGFDFDTYAGVLTFAERVYVRAYVHNVDGDDATVPMPAGGGPTPEELAMLEEWMLCTVYPDAGLGEGEP